MTNNNPITKKVLVETLGEFTERVIFPGVENIIDRRIRPLEKRMDGMEKRMDGMDRWMDGTDKRINGIENNLVGIKKQMTIDKNEILTSNDKLIKELLIMRSEIAAHTKPYRDLDERITYLEKMNVLMLKKLEIA